MGIGFLGLGFQPKWALSDIPIMPKVILSFNPVKLTFLDFALFRTVINTSTRHTCSELFSLENYLF